MTQYFNFSQDNFDLDMYCHVREVNGELVASEFGIEDINEVPVMFEMMRSFSKQAESVLDVVTSVYSDELQEAALAGLDIDEFLTDEREAAQERNWEADNDR